MLCYKIDVKKKYIGRVISYNDMVFMLANVVITIFIGTMANFTTTTTITICLGIAFYFCLLLYKDKSINRLK